MANSGVYEEDYGQDSDHDSLYADADSPTDGYFTQRPFPRSQFVENSSVAAEATAKAQEAAEDRASNSRAHSLQLISPTSPSRSPIWANADERTPLLDAGPAPPDYAAATAHRSTSSEGNSGGSDDTLRRPQSYGSITEIPPPPPANHHQWPLGNQGNPFNSPNFPFGAAGSPWSDPQFPFGRINSPFRQSVLGGRMDNNTAMPAFRAGPPQSMSGQQPQYGAQGRQDEEIADVTRPQTRKQRRSIRYLTRCFRPCSCLSWLAFVGIVVLIVLMSTLRGSQDSSHKTPSSEAPGHGAKPPDKSVPQVPAQPAQPTIPSFPANRTLTHCPLDTFTETHKFDFSTPEFHFFELMESREASGIDISGTVWIQPAPAEQEVDIKVFLSYATTKHWRVAVKRFVQEGNTLKLQFPELEQQANAFGQDTSCLDVAVAIQIREGVRLDQLSITSANLDVRAEEGLFRSAGSPESSRLDIANTSSITAIRGKVDLAYWSSRETVVDIISGSIRGHFALRDLLVLKSQSGSISALVDPRDADAQKAAPADLAVTSGSGSIHVALPLSDRTALSGYIPNRDYRTRVESRSGTISGDYYLGTTTTIYSTSSSIKANILPYDWSDWAATFRTESRSGSTDLRVLPSYKHADRPVGHVHSYHKSSSSSLKLRYPAQWSGTIDGESMSGSINIRGKGVVIDFDEHYSHVVRHVVAHKGDGSSTMDFRSRSGSVDLAIGED